MFAWVARETRLMWMWFLLIFQMDSNRVLVFSMHNETIHVFFFFFVCIINQNFYCTFISLILIVDLMKKFKLDWNNIWELCVVQFWNWTTNHKIVVKMYPLARLINTPISALSLKGNMFRSKECSLNLKENAFNKNIQCRMPEHREKLHIGANCISTTTIRHGHHVRTIYPSV